MIAQDPELIADVDRRITVGSTAERAVYDAFSHYRELLLVLVKHMAGRVADLDDVRNRIVCGCSVFPCPGCTGQ
ncbi:Phosphoenolpyruvate-protein phosphotransferase OS=Streptomyces alboniger OX=132473 GN=ptsP PE=3 SV=1 [Streptomyces alboniger]